MYICICIFRKIQNGKRKSAQYLKPYKRSTNLLSFISWLIFIVGVHEFSGNKYFKRCAHKTLEIRDKPYITAGQFHECVIDH